MPQQPSALTDKVRKLYGGLFALTILAALLGWLFFERDTNMLIPVLVAVTTAAGIGEASNVGKRATYNAKAHEIQATTGEGA